jgi:dTDP-4-amino-4,6-dideoxygalactose transaminase
LRIRERTDWNYSYYPVIFESEEQLFKVQKGLNENQIFPRRYFYPSLNTIEYAKGMKMLSSESIAARILCLPLYVGLPVEDMTKIVTLINKNLC